MVEPAGNGQNLCQGSFEERCAEWMGVIYNILLLILLLESLNVHYAAYTMCQKICVG